MGAEYELDHERVIDVIIRCDSAADYFCVYRRFGALFSGLEYAAHWPDWTMNGPYGITFLARDEATLDEIARRAAENNAQYDQPPTP